MSERRVPRAMWVRARTLAAALLLGITALGCSSKPEDQLTGEVSQAVGSCNSPKCLIGGVCYSSGQLNPLNDCQSCQSGATSWTNLSSATSCASDGLSCTSDLCNGAGTCKHTLLANRCLISGACYSDATKNPVNDCQSCQSAASTSAWSNLSSATTCATDGLSCTSDLCNGSGSCTHSLQSGACLISGACYANGASNPVNGCQQCQSAATASAWSNASNSTACTSDGISCTNDLCNGSGACAHPLQASACLIGGACYASGALNPTNSCQSCQPGTSTSAWTTAANNTGCTDDGISCTSDLCVAGTCTHALQPASCLIGGACYPAGSANGSNTCQTCQPSTTTSAWTNVANNTACSDDGLTCTTDVCQAGSCNHTLQANTCLITGACYASGTFKPGIDCQSCQPATSTTSWTDVAQGQACPDDGLACTTDICTKHGSTVTCDHNPGNAGTVCRAAAGVCDAAETCTGSSSTCPGDSYQPSSVVCRSAVGPCDKPETCSGTSASCPADVLQPSGYVCRAASAAGCDVAEVCSGSTTTCPADVLGADGTTCPDEGNSCTVDLCQGGSCSHTLTGATCTIAATCYAKGATNPTNSCQTCDPTSNQFGWTLLTDGNACASDGLSCTVDVCGSGLCTHGLVANACAIGGTCYAEGAFDPSADCQQCKSATSTTSWTALAAGAACADDGNACTADACAKHGNTMKCDHNPAPSGTVCRAAQGDCDVAETCPGGNSTTCPADKFAAAGTVCTDDGNACTTDTCDGSGWSCNHAAGNVGAVCRSAANECDYAETCDGSATCPVDQLKADGVPCSDDGNACTYDRCKTGQCAHAAGNAGALCRAARDACDFPEVCDGVAVACPVDAFQPDGTACNDGNGCTQTDACVAGSCAGSNPVLCAAAAACATSSCSPATGQCVDTPIASCFTANLDYVKVSVDYTVPKSIAAVDECNTLNNWSATKLNPKVSCVPQTITTYTPFVVTRMFDGVCPKDTSPKWQFFVYTTSTPPNTRIEFRFRSFPNTTGSCDALPAVTADPPVPVAVASLTQDPEVCGLVSDSGACPKNLFTALGGLPAGGYECLQMDAYGVPSVERDSSAHRLERDLQLPAISMRPMSMLRRSEPGSRHLPGAALLLSLAAACGAPSGAAPGSIDEVATLDAGSRDSGKIRSDGALDPDARAKGDAMSVSLGDLAILDIADTPCVPSRAPAVPLSEGAATASGFEKMGQLGDRRFAFGAAGSVAITFGYDGASPSMPLLGPLAVAGPKRCPPNAPGTGGWARPAALRRARQRSGKPGCARSIHGVGAIAGGGAHRNSGHLVHARRRARPTG